MSLLTDCAQMRCEVAQLRARARPQLRVGDGSRAKRFRWSLERSDEVGGDPATVEVARLRLHPLVAHPGDIHAPGMERDVIVQRLIGRRRVAIGPRDCMNAAAVDDRVEVARGAFEFTPGRLRATVGQQSLRTSSGGTYTVGG
jgi:hypothetical protein